MFVFLSNVEFHGKLIHGNHDRAWNDPPLFAYDASKSLPAQDKKMTLNKRISFPLSGTGSVPGSTSVSHMETPPLQTNKIPSLVSSAIPQCSDTLVPFSHIVDKKNDIPNSLLPSSNEDVMKDEDRREIVTHTFEFLLSKCESNLQKKKAEEVARRLNCLKESWQENKLEDIVKKRIHDLSSALAAGDYEQANNIHLELIVNYAGQVSPWMVGIKHLIHQSKILELKMENTAM